MSENSALKLIVIGSPSVGKSSLLQRYTSNEFKEAYQTTLGVEFCSKLVTLSAGSSIKLQIWDTAGQESFRSIINTFYRNVSVVFLVYSITSMSSFEDLQFWYSQAVEHCQPDVVMVLIGAQCDRQSQRQVSKEMAEEFMCQKGISFMFETSAKENTNVEIAFQQAAKQVILKKVRKGKKDTTNEVPNGGGRISVRAESRKGSCC